MEDLDVAQQQAPRGRGRRLWFQLHKWIGLLLFVLLVPICLTGSALVWHDWTDSLVNPHRYAVGALPGEPRASLYVAAARRALPDGARIASVTFPDHGEGPVVVAAAPANAPRARGGPPPRTLVWLDPATARVVDRAESSGEFIRILHVLHGSLMIPGWGRPLVGWLGLALLLSCLSGILLWWPKLGGVLRGLRWRRGPLISGNIHHQLGIWIAIPLAVLSLTGVYISFPNFFLPLETLAGGRASAGPPMDRRAPPASAPRIAPDAALAAAIGESNGRPLSLRWPTEKAPQWMVAVETAAGAVEFRVDDRSGAVEPAPRRGGIAVFMRRLHDGIGYNRVWQAIIFAAGLIPAVLAVTGVIMWLRTRGWRRSVTDRQAARRMSAA